MEEDIRLLRDPIRLAAAVGVLLIAIGAVGPWVTGKLPSGAVLTFNGFSVFSDGGVAILFGVLQVVVLASHAVDDSKTRFVQVLPFALGGVALAYAAIAIRNIGAMIDLAGQYASSVTISWGIWVMSAGALASTLAGLALSRRLIRVNPGTHSPNERSLFDLDFVIGIGAVFGGLAIGLVVGLIGGGAVFHWAAMNPFSPALGLVGAIVGAYVGHVLGRWLVMARRSPAASGAVAAKPVRKQNVSVGRPDKRD